MISKKNININNNDDDSILNFSLDDYINNYAEMIEETKHHPSETTEKFYYDYQHAVSQILNKNQILLRYGDMRAQWCIFPNRKKFYEKLIQLKNYDRLYHEVILDSRPRKMFCDIDAENISITRFQIIDNFNNVMSIIFQKLNFGIFDRKNIYLTMSKGYKKSFHWIYHDKHVFKNKESQMKFWRYVYDYINKNCSILCFKNKKNEDVNILDLQTYFSNHTMRTLYSNKESDKNRTLVPVGLNTKQHIMNEIHQVCIDYNDYLIMTTQRKFYFNIDEIPNIKLKIKLSYIDIKKDNFNPLLLKGEYGFAQICKHKFDHVRFFDDSKNCYIYNKYNKLWELKSSLFMLTDIVDIIEPKLNEEIKKYKNKLNENISEDYKKYYKELLKECKKGLKNIYSVRSRSQIIKELQPFLTNPNFHKNINSSLYLLPLQNGKIINLKTKELRDRTIDDHFSFECPVSYIDNIDDKFYIIEKFIYPIFQYNKNLINYIQRILGMCLSESLDNRQFYIFIGTGRNGKSALIDIIKYILDSYFLQASEDVFMMNNKKSSGSATSHLYALNNKRLVVCPEIGENEKLNVKNIKSITGNDVISCRELYGKQQIIKPVCKLIQPTNFYPEFDCNDTAIIDRLCCIPFNSKFVDIEHYDSVNNTDIFKADPDLIEKIKSDYIDIFFSWLVEGSYLYFNDKENNKKPDIVKFAINKLVVEVDYIQRFLSDQCRIDKSNKNYFCECKHLYNKYNVFCGSENLKVFSYRKFVLIIKNKGYIKKQKMLNGTPKHSFFGIQLIED